METSSPADTATQDPDPPGRPGPGHFTNGPSPYRRIATRAALGLSPQAAHRILISLMVPSMMMPLASSMSRVALPVIRDDFQISADVTAWVATAFTLPFMVLMPVYGRLSDGLGKRRLILAGCVIFSMGTVTTLLAPDLSWLMAGRALQAIGTAGIMPMGMALISTIFGANERGKALGTWSTVGPTLAFIGPLSAGFLIERWGWHGAFAPPLAIAILALLVVWKEVPAGLSNVRPDFLRTFDWAGVVLLAAAMASFLFYLSSRPITGVAPLKDWRLLMLAGLLTAGFVAWERQRTNPFVAFGMFTNRIFSVASFCAAMRMVTVAGLGFLGPLYLVDVRGLTPTYVGLISMVSPGTMALITRSGGLLADRWGSRWPAALGLAIQGSVMVIFSQLPGTVPLGVIAATLAYNGVGAGLILASLHRAAMGNVSEHEMGMAAGFYSMIRFAGAAVGTALGGVILQVCLDRAATQLDAYQTVFMFFAGFAFLGSVVGLSLREPPLVGTRQVGWSNHV